MDQTLSLLDQRRSTPSRLLGEPGPDDATLRRLIQSALRVPDHGALAPWRIIVIRGPMRQRLGELLAQRSLEKDPTANAAVVEKDRQRFNHAPLVLAVVARVQPGHRIPEQEQLMSAGCVCFSLLLGAQSLGFGAQWLTGWAAYDAVVAQRLGLVEHERIAGFIHIGTASQSIAERPRPDPDELIHELKD